MIPTLNGYFSGCGLAEIGLQKSGCTLGQSFEIDRDCVKVAEANFDHVITPCDLRHKLASDEQPCDAAVFTYPCKVYSPIGALHKKRRRGPDGQLSGDELYMHAFRHAALNRYPVYVAENVPGMKMFPVVMEAMTRLPGYHVSVFCPVKTALWLPQHRDRLIIFASKRRFEWRAPVAPRRRVRLAEIVERDPEFLMPDYIKARLRGQYRDLPIISDPARDELAPTCVAHYGKDQGTRLVADRRFAFGARPYSVREWARLQGVPDSFKFPVSRRAAYEMIGNGVSVPVGQWIGRELLRYFA
jgi:DNA (cytosine-5)-methyltransferase 1